MARVVSAFEQYDSDCLLSSWEDILLLEKDDSKDLGRIST